MNEEQIRAERRIKWVYGFLFISIITFLISAMCFTSVANAFYYSDSLWGHTIAPLLPALVFLVLLFGLRPPYLFVRRHAQQAMLLAALVTALVWAYLGLELVRVDIAYLVFLLTWLGGSFWGWRQVNRGDCWLMRVRGEGELLPRPWATPKKDHAINVELLENPIEEGMGSTRSDATFARLLTTFRNGSPEERQQAAAELEKLGEVEVY